jgi:hypothetical protein
MFAKFPLLLTLVCCLLGALSSCHKDSPSQDLYELSQQSQFEGVSLHLQVSQSTLKTNECVRVILDIKHDPSLEITLPDLAGRLGEFTFAEVTTQPAKLDSQSWVHRQISFLLEPDLPGESTLPPFEFVIENPLGEIRKIQTKPIAIQVLSVGVDGDTQLRDIAPDEPESLLPISSKKIITGLVVALVLASGGILIFIKTRPSSDVFPTKDLDDFLALGGCSSEQILDQIEKFFCKAYSEQTRLTKPCANFDSLSRFIPPSPRELSDLIAKYESAQYSKKTLTKDEISELYQQFTKLLCAISRQVDRP